MSIETTTSLADIILQFPAAARLLERLGLDYCCGGRQTLADACQALGLDPAEIIEQISEQDNSATPKLDWSTESLETLINHIISTHHTYTRDELARLAPLMTKVKTVHGAEHPELVQIAYAFQALDDDLIPHLMKEENILFPYICNLEAYRRTGTPPPTSCFGTVANPIYMMNKEHDEAGVLLRRMRELSKGFTLPADACASYRNLYEGLEALEHDLMQHIHLENHLVFPRALTLESGDNI